MAKAREILARHFNSVTHKDNAHDDLSHTTGCIWNVKKNLPLLNMILLGNYLDLCSRAGIKTISN